VRGAVANDAGDPVPQELMDERYKRFMELQQKISTRRLKRKVGRREKVIIDSVTNGIARGRTRGDAPEIDGLVHLTMRRPVRVGEIVTGLIERSDEYDLHGQVVGF
jgi:ribosomal protein S12 methylthiotransferase